jgi:hypothetical protein
MEAVVQLAQLAIKATEVVIVSGEPAKSDELPGADIAHHLARHGVKVEVERIASTEADIASVMALRYPARCDLVIRPLPAAQCQDAHCRPRRRKGYEKLLMHPY